MTKSTKKTTVAKKAAPKAKTAKPTSKALSADEAVPQLVRSTKSTSAVAKSTDRKKTKQVADYALENSPLAAEFEVAPIQTPLQTKTKLAAAKQVRTSKAVTAPKAAKPVPENAASSRSSRLRQPHARKALVMFAVVCLVGAAGYGAWLYAKPSPAKALAADKQLIADVSKRVVLPQDETPAISTIVDEKKINQEFLRGAKKGDKVLLYFQAGRAIVYRPSSGQVINTGPLAAPIPRVFIRNGTANTDVSKVVAAINASKQFNVDSRDSSPKNTYTKTVVIDVFGNRPDVAKKLADTLQVSVVPLPAGESRPDADLMVLVGSDYTKP